MTLGTTCSICSSMFNHVYLCLCMCLYLYTFFMCIYVQLCSVETDSDQKIGPWGSHLPFRDFWVLLVNQLSLVFWGIWDTGLQGDFVKSNGKVRNCKNLNPPACRNCVYNVFILISVWGWTRSVVVMFLGIATSLVRLRQLRDWARCRHHVSRLQLPYFD